MNLSLSSNDLLSTQAADTGINLSKRDQMGNRILEVDILDNNYTDNHTQCRRVINIIFNNFYLKKIK